MTENVENLILEHLRAIRADIATVKNDIREIKQWLTNLETGSAGQRRDDDIADQHARYDRLAERIERIERRLEIQDESNSIERETWQIAAIQEGVEAAKRGEFAGSAEVKRRFARWGVEVEG